MNAATRVPATIDTALRTAEERFTAANPLSIERHRRACGVLPGGHSRQTLYYRPFPLTIARGNGARIVDLDGHEYLNLAGDYTAGLYGHTCEPIQEAVRSVLDLGITLSGPNASELELAELISSRIPSMEQLRFCNSGSEACLYAAQLARHATGRPTLLVFHGSYHGGFMNYGAVDSPLSMPFPIVKAAYNDVEGTRAVLRANGSELAAVLVEPMLGSGGCIPGIHEFLAMLREETQRLGIVLIFDEVMTSRLGPGGLQGLHGLRPDLTTLGKFWGGGFTFGAFGGARDLMRHFDTQNGGALSQAGTFNNNVVTMTAGLVGARDVYTPEACARLNALGDSLRHELNGLGSSLGLAFQASGIGSVLNTQWSADPICGVDQVRPANHPSRRLLHLELIERGYYTAPRGLIALSLPLTETDVEGFIHSVRDVLTSHRFIWPSNDLPSR
jgi:glutamate-1-semialdehyde 2,1-aminomutase